MTIDMVGVSVRQSIWWVCWCDNRYGGCVGVTIYMEIVSVRQSIWWVCWCDNRYGGCVSETINMVGMLV